MKVEIESFGSESRVTATIDGEVVAAQIVPMHGKTFGCGVVGLGINLAATGTRSSSFMRKLAEFLLAAADACDRKEAKSLIHNK